MRIAHFAVLGVASWLLPQPHFAVNEEAFRQVHDEMRIDSEAVQNATRHTSLRALQSLAAMHPDVVSLIQESLRSHHRHRHHHEIANPYAPVQPAVLKLSEQIKDAAAKWEVQNQRCCKWHTSQMAELEEIAEAIALVNAQSSAAQAEILKANKKIAILESRIPTEKDALKDLRAQCASEKKSWKHDVQENLVNLHRVDSMKISCTGKVLLVQCAHPSTGESFLAVDHHAVRKSVTQWQAPVVQRFLQGFVSKNDLTGQPVLLQTHEQWNPSHSQCRMAANPDCEQLRDRYLMMTSDLEDAGEELHETIAEGDRDCETKVNDAEQSIGNAMRQLKQTQTALAEATGDYNGAMEASRLKQDERENFIKNMNSETKKCNDAKAALLTEKFGLLKIRGELLGMNGLKLFITDCKVSDWTPGECSQPCGGGTRIKTRQVLAHPVGDGAQCPPLQVTEGCNTKHCPVDCTMGDWGGWSACSAKCGGGVFERVRDIKRRGRHGGKPCGETQEIQSCNVQGCDENCKLSRWSKWSKCSKACDGGTTFKIRRVKKAAVGEGTCPKKFSKRRIRTKACSTKRCLGKKDVGKTLKCKSKLDVILLIDGSASLRSTGWDATKDAAINFAKAMGSDVMLAAIVFSGPTSRTNYFKCTGQRSRITGKFLGTPDMEKDCLVKWIDHFTQYSGKVADHIKLQAWPRGSTMTSEALSLADTELSGGRKDAQSVVVTITDGKPMNKRNVRNAARRLRKKARVMWIAVGKDAPRNLLRQWASRPKRENVIPVSSFTALKSKRTLNRIISTMCPMVEKV